MSHRKDILDIIEKKWKTTPPLVSVTFVAGKVNLGTVVPRVSFLQRQGGLVADTTGRAYWEKIPYYFELFSFTYEEADRYGEIIEDTFDRCDFKVEGKTVMTMTRTAPTLVEEVGSSNFRTIAFYEIEVNLERSRGAG